MVVKQKEGTIGGKYIISIDGNDTGKLLEKYIFTNDIEIASDFSNYMLHAVNNIKNYIESANGIVYVAGGDNVIAEIDKSAVVFILRSIKIYETDEIHFSIGIGDSVLNAYMALKYAKSIRSSDPIIYDGMHFRHFN